MANWLGNSGNIAEGWGGPPQLNAANISGLVGEILRNRLARDKMSQEGIADTIRNVREERQSAEYLEQMKAAGLIPADYDAGGIGGAKLGTGLAKMIQDQKEFEAREEHRRAMEARVGGRGGRGSRGDGGGGSGGSGSGSAEPQTVWKDGVEWRPGPGGRWIPMKPAGGTKAGEKPTDLSKAVKERMNLVDQFDTLEADRLKQEAQNIKDKQADVPFKQSDLYNLTRNRLKQLEEVPGMPSTAPAESGNALQTSRPPASDKAGGHAESYGVPPVGTERGGYRFKGGDPKDPNSWEPI